VALDKDCFGQELLGFLLLLLLKLILLRVGLLRVGRLLLSTIHMRMLVSGPPSAPTSWHRLLSVRAAVRWK
jgi:hypothetical protein